MKMQEISKRNRMFTHMAMDQKIKNFILLEAIKEDVTQSTILNTLLLKAIGKGKLMAKKKVAKKVTKKKGC